MAQVKIRQLAGDIRMWTIDTTTRVHTPTIADASDPTGCQPIETNSVSFSYEAGDETVIKSKRRGSLYNQPKYTDSLPGTTKVTIGLLETPTPIFARMLYGSAADADISSGSVSAGSLLVSRLDAPIRLAHRYIKASPALTLATSGPVSLTEGTDYKLDLRTGTVTILSAGTVGTSISVGDTLTINYDYETITGTTILGGATPTQSFFITGDMEDRNSTDQGYLEVFEAKMTVDGDVDWLSAEPIQPVLTGTAVVPDGAPAPYRFDVYNKTD